MSTPEMDLDNLPNCLKVHDVQKFLNISRATAYSLVRQPGFPSIRVSQKIIKVPKDKFLLWVDNRAKETLG